MDRTSDAELKEVTHLQSLLNRGTPPGFIVQLKAWRKSSLKCKDWDFSSLLDWPEDALKKAWTWEIERELDSRRGPFVNAIKSRPQHPAPPMLKSYSFQELAKYIKPETNWIPAGGNYFTTILPLEIDFTKSKTELLEAFGNWLESGKAPFRYSYEHVSVFKRKVGQRKTAGFLARFRELAIYRISEAGFTRTQGLVMLGNITMSPANWEHAQARTNKHILRHLEVLLSIAYNMSRSPLSHSSPDWRDYFTSL